MPADSDPMFNRILESTTQSLLFFGSRSESLSVVGRLLLDDVIAAALSAATRCRSASRARSSSVANIACDGGGVVRLIITRKMIEILIPYQSKRSEKTIASIAPIAEGKYTTYNNQTHSKYSTLCTYVSGAFNVKKRDEYDEIDFVAIRFDVEPLRNAILCKAKINTHTHTHTNFRIISDDQKRARFDTTQHDTERRCLTNGAECHVACVFERIAVNAC
jgi:hypothetical protein